MNKIFLGGTCGTNHWRELIVIPGLLERGMDLEQIFNPVVAHWTPECQQREDAAKADPETLQLFVLASPDPDDSETSYVSGYRLVEATMALYDACARTAILIDTANMSARAAKVLRKCRADWQVRFPDAAIFHSYSDLLDDLASRLTRVEVVR